MPSSGLTRSHDIELRWYDGTPPGPNNIPLRKYLVGVFIGDPVELPGIPPRPNERIYTDRGLANKWMARIVENDDAIFMQIPATITFLLHADLLHFATAIGNPAGELPWKAFGEPLTPVTSIGYRINSRGEEVQCPVPDDYMKARWLLDLYIKYKNPPSGGDSLTVGYRGVSLLARRITTEPPAIRVTNDIEIWGGIEVVGGFPDGVEIVP